MTDRNADLYPATIQDMPLGRLAEINEDLTYSATKHDRNYRIGPREMSRTIMNVMVNGSYELGETKFRIRDAVWGDELIGDGEYDQMLLELARTPVFRRMQGIEQLTLPAEYATMPNSMYFSRWEHVWGSLVFVRKMTEKDKRFTERDRMVYQLRTLLSDVGHTAFSHLGDWMFEGDEGGEKMHDEELRELLQMMGVGDILQKYGFTLDETVFPETQDWVEAGLPALCVDRVDYALREMMRWMPGILDLRDYQRHLAGPKSLFQITKNNQLAITDERFARLFAAGFALLPTEHWAHPVHRMLLNLLQVTVKSVVLNDLGMFAHPRDAMYGVDANFAVYFKTWSALLFDKLLADIALSQRHIFADARQPELKELFQEFNKDGSFPEYPEPLRSYSWMSEKYGGPYPAQTEFKTEDIVMKGIRVASGGLEIGLPPLKSRRIDPLVKCGRTYRTLSILEPSYGAYQDSQARLMTQGYVGKILMRAEVAQLIAKKTQEIERRWEQALKLPKSSAERMSIINHSWIWAAGNRFDRIVETTDDEVDRSQSSVTYWLEC